MIVPITIQEFNQHETICERSHKVYWIAEKSSDQNFSKTLKKSGCGLIENKNILKRELNDVSQSRVNEAQSIRFVQAKFPFGSIVSGLISTQTFSTGFDDYCFAYWFI